LPAVSLVWTPQALICAVDRWPPHFLRLDGGAMRCPLDRQAGKHWFRAI